jgi:preprotein translocase subunit SecE
MANPLRVFQPVVTYFRGVRDEAGKVSWPSRKETVSKTTIVLVSSVIVGVGIGVIDFVLTRMMAFLVQ